MIYFDNAATTFPKPNEVYNALDSANRNFAFNAGRGEYRVSTETFDLINETRQKLSRFIGVNASNVIFTASATESLNLIINGVDIKEGDHIYVSPFEHNAVARTLYNLSKKVNFSLHLLKFDKHTWIPKMDDIQDEFSIYPPKMVVLSHVSNVTGYILPYDEIFSYASKWDSINVLDCAQSLGVIDLDNIENVNYIVFAGHKSLYASFGVAGFFKLKDDILSVYKSGGTGTDSLNLEMPNELPSRYEAGSMNAVAIAGLNASIDWLFKTPVYCKEEIVYKYLIEQLNKIDNVILYKPENVKCFGVVSFNVKGYSSEDVASILNDEFDICVRSGYHCAPYIHEFLDSKKFYGTVRVSLSYFNNCSEVDVLINAIKTL